MNIFIDCMIRAAKSDANLYEEVEADKSALVQSMSVVILAGTVGVCIIGWIIQIIVLGIFYGII